jgi:XTP/dITP diphosphohydrolase
MSAKIVLATTNEHKTAEILQLAALLGWQAQLVPLSRFPRPPKVAEDGKTYGDNAKKKAVATAQNCGIPALGEDSGMEVLALNRAPGIHSARFMERVAAVAGCSSQACAQSAANRDIIRQLGRRADSERDAKYVSVVCLAFPGGKVFCEKGECRGRIAQKERGTAGFGFDPVFLPEDFGYEHTFGELGQKAKNTVSHRRRALEALVAKIRGK